MPAVAVAGVEGAVASVYSANNQSHAARDAAKAQTQAAGDANKLQLQMFNQARADNEPFRQNALAAQSEYMQLMGLGAPQQAPQAQGVQANTQGLFTQGTFANNPFDRFAGNRKMAAMDPLREMLPRGPQMLQQPQQQQQQAAAPALTPQQMQQSAFDRFRNTPGYQFGLDEGQKQLESSAAARGGLYSGKTGKDLIKYGVNYSDQYGYAPYMNRLASLAGMGQTVNAQNQQAGMNYANQAGGNLINAGNARASGLQGQANAYSNMAGNLSGIAGWMAGQWGGR
jgi:hypothetical protein